jgi:arabinoxylan arabinofuranohydrolase
MVAGWEVGRRKGLVWKAMEPDADKAHDDNYATLWRPGADRQLIADLGHVTHIRQSAFFPEFVDRPWHFSLDASTDGHRWRRIAPDIMRQGSPLIVRHDLDARYLRLRVPAGQAGGLWEWRIEG